MITRGLLSGLTLGGIAFATAQSIATADWLTALPLLIILATGIVLIAPQSGGPSAASAASLPARATEDSARATGEGRR